MKPKSTTKKIAKLARAGMDARNIAEQVDVHLSTVYTILRRLQIKPKSSRDHAPLADRKRVLSLVAKFGPTKAARELGVSKQAVYLRIQRWRSVT